MSIWQEGWTQWLKYKELRPSLVHFQGEAAKEKSLEASQSLDLGRSKDKTRGQFSDTTTGPVFPRSVSPIMLTECVFPLATTHQARPPFPPATLGQVVRLSNGQLALCISIICFQDKFTTRPCYTQKINLKGFPCFF